MTKYILHGGETGIKCKSNSDFFGEISKGIKEPIKILAVYFSRPKDEWGDLFKNDKVNFSSSAIGKKVKLILASENKEEFIEQIKNTDAVYMRGGKPNLLKEHLDKVNNFKKLFKGKTIAGSSAGAMVLSKYAHSRSSIKPFLGLAILPLKIVVHYSQNMKNKLEDLENYGNEKMKTYAIPETEFIILNK